MVYKPNRPYVNKKGRLILGDGIKKRLKTKQRGKGLVAILGPIVKVVSFLFSSGKKRYGKKKQNCYGKTRYAKTRKITYGRTFYVWYKRTKRANLLANIRLERVYRQWAAPRSWGRPQSRQVADANQQGQEIGDFFRVAKKIAKKKIAQNIGKKHLNICQTFMKICQEK